MRLDVRVSEFLGVSRNRAQFFIEHSLIMVEWVVRTKVSYEVTPEMVMSVREDPQLWYVSRSAQKLEEFIKYLESIVVAPKMIGVRVLDVGASTGGFTQVLLARGVSSVVAVEIGKSQLHTTLRWDTRIESLEQTDIREWDSPEKFSLVVVDVSFISLRLVLDSILSHMESGGSVILLFKPQFEVKPEDLTRSGVPRTEAIRLETLEEFRVYLRFQNIRVIAEAESTLHGEAGNREVLFLIQKDR